ncbi:MAG: hypothetical protein JWO23_1230 [Solirubrobacterales bacterium]|jgi:hypothetical protein|nr:hypothetical protein [Solirubrobacterales bacterium]
MANVTTGRPYTGQDKPTHVKGIKEGNAPGNYAKMKGHNPDGTSTAARSTGVHTAGEEPIDPSMPNLSPA